MEGIVVDVYLLFADNFSTREGMILSYKFFLKKIKNISSISSNISLLRVETGSLAEEMENNISPTINYISSVYLLISSA